MKIKKLLCAILCVCLILPAFFMIGCGGNNEGTTKVMQLSLNPEIEFVLDKNNKVVTVNALNEDGYSILSADVNFVGLTAEDAAKKFLEIAKDQKFIIESSSDKIEISISGEDANKLYESVKNTAKNYLDSVSISNITFEIENISKDDLKEKVQEAFSEYTSTALNDMSEEQLIELIKQSRNETKNFVNEQAKELYYTLREQKLLEAQFKAISEKLAAQIPLISDKLNSFTTALQNSIQLITPDFNTYKQELASYIAAKKAYLEAQANGAITDAITKTYNDAKVALDDIDDELEIAIKGIENAVAESLTILKTACSLVLNNLPSEVKTAISTAQTSAVVALQEAFKAGGELASFNISGWNNAN